MEYMGVGDACKEWDLARTTIKRYCAEGKIKAEKVSGRWLIFKNQPNPGQPEHPKNWRGKR